MFYTCWNKPAAFQIFPVDFIFLFFSDYQEKDLLKILQDLKEKHNAPSKAENLRKRRVKSRKE